MITRIGITAGTILEYLDENDEAELSELFSYLDFSSELILMSLGWLVRKGYVTMQRDEHGCKIYLKQENRQRLKTINCPHFQGRNRGVCLAKSEGLMIPSVYELENFCRSGNYEHCPIRIKSKSENSCIFE